MTTTIVEQLSANSAGLRYDDLPGEVVHQAMSRQGLEPETSTSQELAARIKAETRVWAEVIREAGIKAE